MGDMGWDGMGCDGMGWGLVPEVARLFAAQSCWHSLRVGGGLPTKPVLNFPAPTPFKLMGKAEGITQVGAETCIGWDGTG